MKKLSGHVQSRFCQAVHPIAYHRESQPCHVNPDLVGSACVQAQVRQGKWMLQARWTRDQIVGDLEVCQGIPYSDPDNCGTCRKGSLTLAPARVASQWNIHGSTLGFEPPVQQGRVGLAYRAFAELSLELDLSGRSACDHYQARRAHVETVDQTQAAVGTKGMPIGPAMDECVDQGPVGMAGPRVHGQAGWLVNDRQVLILKDNRQVGGPGFDGSRQRCRHCDRDGLARVYTE